MSSETEAFFAKSQHLADEQWLQALIDHNLIKFDWPKAVGGLDWSRQDKLNFVQRLIEAGCPPLPEGLTLTAPLLIEMKQDDLLDRLIAHLGDAHLVIEDSIILVLGDDRVDVSGSGQVVELLAMAYSPIYQLFELRSTLRHIVLMNEYWQREADDELTELEIELSSLEALYLQESATADLQIALKTNLHQLTSYSMLFQALGYYALLDPDPLLTANERIPFQRERQHLKHLRSLIGRSDMYQQDQLFARQLEQLS